MTPAARTPAGSSDIRLNAGGGGDGGRAGGRGAPGAPSNLRGGENNGNSNGAASATTAAEATAGVAESGAGESRGGGGGGEGGIGHLIGLGARLGTFFPPAVGPGPVPGLEQLLQEASDTVSTAEQYPPTPGYKYGGIGFPDAAAGGGGEGRGSAAGPGGSAAEAADASARFFATPGLTPIPTARTPGVGFGGDMGGGGGGCGVAEEDTPSMFLTGLLRGGSPAIAGTSGFGVGGGAGISMRDTPGGDFEDDEDGHGRAAGARATRMAAAGLAPPTTGGGAATATAGGRATRAAGGRRVGGRLSFSSAVGMDDGSGGEGTAAAGRAQTRRWAARGPTAVPFFLLLFCWSGFATAFLR